MLMTDDLSEIFVDIMSEQTATAAAANKIGFDEAFAQHHRVVFRAARSVVRDCSTAEDIVQETYLRLYRNFASIDNEEMLRPWLIRVAINLAKNSIRGQVRANTREENYVKVTGEMTAASVEADYEQQAGVNDIFNALNELREPMRSCLILKQQGLSYKEIAASLDINIASVGTYIARARQDFARLYNGRDGQGR